MTTGIKVDPSSTQRRPETRPSSATMSTPLEAFFAQFARLSFGYRRSKTAHSNFNRLCKLSGWIDNSTEFPVVKAAFNDVLVQQFSHIYGTDSSLEAWRNLCSVIDITPIPDDIKECQRCVGDAHVNIVDLIEAERTGKHVRRFASLEQLRQYTLSTGKIFPKEKAYAGGLLKELLRELVNPYDGKRRNGSQKRKRRKACERANAMRSSS